MGKSETVRCEAKDSRPVRVEPEPSIINEKTIADFTRVVEQTGILGRESGACAESATAGVVGYRRG